MWSQPKPEVYLPENPCTSSGGGGGPLRTSKQGWGAVCGCHTLSGGWTQEQAHLHINYLEMLAVYPALKRSGVSAVWPACTDSILSEQSKRDLTLWCMSQQISLMAVHLTGVDSVEANRLSSSLCGESVQDWPFYGVYESDDSPPTFRYVLVGYTYSRPISHEAEPKGRGIFTVPFPTL